MKIIYNKILPPKGFTAINLFGIIFVRKEASPIDEYVINHERIHSAQIRELLYIPFYIIYIIEWLIRLVQYRHPMKAYYNISFEREAFGNHHNLNYLDNRRLYSFRKYICKSRMTKICK